MISESKDGGSANPAFGVRIIRNRSRVPRRRPNRLFKVVNAVNTARSRFGVGMYRGAAQFVSELRRILDQKYNGRNKKNSKGKRSPAGGLFFICVFTGKSLSPPAYRRVPSAPASPSAFRLAGRLLDAAGPAAGFFVASPGVVVVRLSVSE